MQIEMKIMKTVDSLGNEVMDTVCFVNGKEMSKEECGKMEDCKKACESGEMSKEECEKKCAEKGTSCH